MANRPISRLVIVAIAIATSSLTALLYYRAELRQPWLIYNGVDGKPHKGPVGSFAIYSVYIENPGESAIDNIHGEVQLPIDTNVLISADPSSSNTAALLSNIIEIQILRLDPGEKYGVTLTAMSQADLPDNLAFSVHGTNITGVTNREYEDAKSHEWIRIAIVALLAGAVPLMFLTAVNRAALPPKQRAAMAARNKKPETEVPLEIAEENKILAELSRRHGFENEAEAYLAWPHTCVYWAEADKQTADLHKKSPEEIDLRKDLLEDLLEVVENDDDGVNASIIQYNIARITFFQGNLEEAYGHLNKASQGAAKLVENRLKLEPGLRELYQKGKQG